MKRVIVVGGGFGGLNAAKALGSKPGIEVLLLDRQNHHLFQPLLYQVAMAGLDPGDIATPIRTLLSKHQNVSVLMTDVQKVDLTNRTVQTDFASFDYDYLILACGAQHSYFGHDDWEPFAPGLKSLEQAVEIRRRVLTAFELAERETDSERVRQLLTFIVIGGGPTGVELAGSLGEITRYALSSDFRHIDPSQARIILIEAGQRILATFEPRLSQRAARDLENLGVTVWTGARVTKVDEDGVSLGTEKVKSNTVLWAAGVKPSSLNATLETPLDKSGRIIVGPDLSIAGHPHVFVLGDQAHFEQDGVPLPGLAPVAIQQGRWVAKLIVADLKGTIRKTFRYRDKGQMATIGRRRAVAQTKNFKFTGTTAWFAWLLVHIYFLIGFKNRVVVLFEWFWSYLTFKRGTRLITRRGWMSQQS
ncbi:MAG TPA: NAD(P)/FAD-dependent oxidoreductase [Bdellovibrionales bacterium]|nr:NAD(P)/FAD-dependent oxidoreductase [Bdellovibrionales bacterium]